WLLAIKGRDRAGADAPPSTRSDLEQSPGPRGRIARRGDPRMTMSTTPTFVGIDVSKAHLDVAVRPTGAAFRLDNTPAGLAELVARLAPLAPALIVVEATGGYELPAVAALQAAALPVAAINPRQARDFAKGVGKLAKTDRIDAAVLAHFAEAVRPAARS